MQATMNETFRFAGGRDYMMRSEKRGGSGPSHRAPAPGGKKPHRKRRRAGFFYKLLMMLLLLTIWPLGLLMLWQRKVRWGVLTKLLASVVSLAACILVLGSALTVDTNIPEYTAAQNKINGWLDVAADTVIDVSGVVADKAAFIHENASNFAEALWDGGKVLLSNAIDEGVLLAQDVKETVAGWTASLSDSDQSEATPEPEITLEPTAQPTAEPTPEVTSTPEPTPEPTPQPLEFTVKSAEDAVVYYNDGGKCYHMTSACASMKSSVEHTLGETRDVDNHRCSICGTPEKSILDAEYIVWLDGEGIAHLSDECSSFTGKWKLITADEAIEDGAVACTACEADLYLAALATDEEITILRPLSAEPTEEPTEEPAEEDAEADAEALSEEEGEEIEETAEPSLPEENAVEAASEESAADEAASEEPSAEPTEEISGEATKEPTEEPTAEPTEEAVEEDSEEPADEPSAEPTEKPAEDPTEEPAEEPTAAPSEEPSEEATAAPTTAPTPQLIVPTMALKDASEAIVCCAEGDEAYHILATCEALSGGEALSLGEAIAEHVPCAECAAPAAELVDLPCLWQDANGLCHIGDDCSAFEGAYTLVPRDEALEACLAGCTACGAAEYLIENTSIDYAAIPTPTPQPTASPEPTATPNPNAFIYTDILVVDAA